MPAIKLTYFDFPGRAEAARLALTLGGIPFEDERLLVDEFLAIKPTLPYGSLPMLTIDGVEYAQSAAILRYCGRLTGLYPSDLLEAARVDEIIDTIVDFVAGLEQIGNDADPEDDEADARTDLLKYASEAVPRFLGGLDKRLEVFGAGPWAVGDQMTIADLAIYLCLLNIAAGAFDVVTMKPVEAYDRIMNSYETVKAHPKVAAWNEDLARRAAQVRQSIQEEH